MIHGRHHLYEHSAAAVGDDVGRAGELLAASENEGWRGDNAVLLRQLRRFFGIDAGVGDACLVKGANGDLAIWAGARGEEQVFLRGRRRLVVGNAEVGSLHLHH